MFHLKVGPLALVVRTLIVYAAMVVGFRAFGKRELGQVTVFDIAMILLIANAVQNAMVGPDASLLGGLISAATLILANEVMVRLRIHHRVFRKLLEGGPSVLISEGRWHEGVLVREGLDREEVEQAMRENGVLRLDDVRLAVLEANGSISVVPKDSKTVEVPRRGQLGGDAGGKGRREGGGDRDSRGSGDGAGGRSGAGGKSSRRPRGRPIAVPPAARRPRRPDGDGVAGRDPGGSGDGTGDPSGSGGESGHRRHRRPIAVPPAARKPGRPDGDGRSPPDRRS